MQQLIKHGDMSEDRRRTKKQPIDPTYGHIQPQAPEVEKAVLGALMIDKDAYVEVCEILRVSSSSIWRIIGMSCCVIIWRRVRCWIRRR